MEDNQQREGSTAIESDTLGLGAWLRDQRSKKKISLEEIAAVTKIHIVQLKNIEEDRREALPAPAFVRGFLVSYARHLGLDVSEVLLRYKNSWGKKTSLEEPTNLLQGPAAAAPTTALNARPQHAATKDLEQKNQFFLTPRVIFSAAGVLVLLLFISVLIAIGKRQKNPPALPAPSATPQNAVVVPDTIPAKSAAPAPVVPAKEAPKLSPSPAPAPATPAAAAVPVAPKKYQLEVYAVEANWLNVRADDGNSQGLSLKAGARTTFQADRKIVLSLSDAGAIEIKWNGALYAAPGSRGDVKSLTLPEDLASLTPKVAAPRPRPKPVLPAAAAPAAAVAPPPAQ